MGSYLQDIFKKSIDRSRVRTIFELGSRDMRDAVELYLHYGGDGPAPPRVWAFECNPECLELCRETQRAMTPQMRQDITLVGLAVSSRTGPLTFYPFDPQLYPNNPGASSVYRIDFSGRSPDDPDLNHPPCQLETQVEATRLDEYCVLNGIEQIDLVCMDLQEHELEALRGMGNLLATTQYIIAEASIVPSYTGGCCYAQLRDFLAGWGFRPVCSNYGGNLDIPTTTDRLEFFDVLWAKVPAS